MTTLIIITTTLLVLVTVSIIKMLLRDEEDKPCLHKHQTIEYECYQDRCIYSVCEDCWEKICTGMDD